MHALQQSTLAGIAATIPMTMSMAAMHHYPSREGRKLPMEEVAIGLMKGMKIYKNLDQSERDTFTWVSHFAFGAAAGAIFPLVAPEEKGHHVAKGIAFGLGVWAISYIGVLPTLKIMPPITKQPARHVLLEAFAHVVWGAALGALTAPRNKA